MPVWLTIPVETQPDLTLVEWRVVELLDGARHFVGYCLENVEGRVSSTVKSLDLATLVATTKTGRVYGLVGRPGHDGDARYVWNRWREIYEQTEWWDITEAVWQAHATGTPLPEDINEIDPALKHACKDVW